MGAVPRRPGLGQEQLHALAEQLVVRVAEHHQRVLVGHQDDAAAVDDDGGIRRRLQQAPETVFGRLALGDLGRQLHVVALQLLERRVQRFGALQHALF